LLTLAVAACEGEAPPANRGALPERPAISTEEAMRMPFPQSPGARETIDVGELGYAAGPADAPLTVVEFSDFGCPYCARFALESYPQLEREFVEGGMVRWVYVPFVMGNFPNGDLAARAG